MAVRVGSLLAASTLPFSALGTDGGKSPPSLKCDVGPIHKVYGSNQWLVYSCDDKRTIVIVSTPGSPAAPFYFILYPTQKGYQLEGEGTGAASATQAAYKELSALTEQDIAALIELTKGQGVK